MTRARHLTWIWIVATALGVLALVWAFPRAFPFFPETWTITREEAAGIALERLRDLGEPVPDAYVVTHLITDPQLELRLQQAAEGPERERLAASTLPKRAVVWQVLVYPPGAPTSDFRYQVQVSLSGEVLSLRQRLDPQNRKGTVPPAEAETRAATFLTSQGFDLSRYQAPEVLTQQAGNRTDVTVRYREHDLALPEAYGVEVVFTGDRMTGFQPWGEPLKDSIALLETLRGNQLLNFAGLLWIYGFLFLLAFPFLKRYHEGEIGVRRAAQIFVLLAAVGLLVTLLAARASSQSVGFGIASRQQATWLFIVFSMSFFTLPAAVLGFFAWSVGESICRERLGRKLAAFDALFQGDWANATVARSSFVGSAAGFACAGLLAVTIVALRAAGAWPLASFLSYSSRLPLFELLNQGLSYVPLLLVLTLCIVPLLVRRLGKVGGGLVAVVLGAFFLQPPILPAPLSKGIWLSLVFAAVPVVVFLVQDLLASLLAVMIPAMLFDGYLLITADDPALSVQAWLALGIALTPLLVSLRYLGSNREFHYRYEDIPPHVRRIAERERQRVELETARGIQSSILPELPPRLAGVDLAHAYLPATEVGGDFYDVLALEDGRLAVAVGDVAGHGVSSGLVMSMAKSALAVQVTFDPSIEQVFRTLNRMVHQTARKRLLATLCYALLDPKKLELHYASAGHLFPYRITRDGKVDALEVNPNGYPLGVRKSFAVDPHTTRLAPGDTLFLFSDGVVEARPEGSEEQFGFQRLEESLGRHAGKSPAELRDAVLSEVARFTLHAPREDDQTILVLRLP